ncbi:MAG: cupin domain-containing protein [Nanoarchaeota archaeon]
MRIKNRKEIPRIQDTCGTIQEMYHSKNLSVSYATISRKARSHKHEVMEEVYYIVKGEGRMFVGKKSFTVKSGDIIAIPKNVFHHIEKISREPVEMVVVTHPRYAASDVIEEKKR